MCGNDIYQNLPSGWVGVCAPVLLQGHSYIVKHAEDTIARQKPDLNLKPHDSVWGSEVPKEYKLWTAAEQTVLSLFPQFRF